MIMIDICPQNVLHITYLVESFTEAAKDLLHVAVALHGDDAEVIFLVHPHEEVLLFIMPDAARVRPVTCHTYA